MSDDSAVEKFVLTYEANTADTLARLQELSDKIDNIHDKGKKNKEDGVGGLGGEKGKKFSEFLKKTTSELNDFVPGLGKAGDMATKVGTKFAVAAVALVAFAAAMKSIRELSDEYERQRITGSQTGMSAGQVNMYQQRFNAANGRMTGENSRQLLEKVSNLTAGAYTNPDPWNREALQLRNAGVNSAFGKDGKIKSTDQVLDEMTKKFKSVSAQQAQAIGMSMGLTMDETKAIRDRNVAVEESLAVSDTAKARQAEANESMERLGSSTGHLSERWRQVSNTIAQVMVPLLADVVDYIDKITTGLPETLDKALSSYMTYSNRFGKVMEKIQDPSFLLHPVESYRTAIKEADDLTKSQIAEGKKKAEEQQNVANQSYKTQKEFERNVNLFASSVSAFSGVIDERQAWASWAGQVGAAGGLSGLGQGAAGQAAASGGGNGYQVGGYTVQRERPNTPANTHAFDDIFEQVSKETGMPVDRLKAVAGAESNFKPTAVSRAGAYGIMQVMPGNFKPGDDRNNPYTQIKRGAEVLKWAYGQANGDWDEAYRWYNGGKNRGSKENREYAGRVNDWHKRLYEAPVDISRQTEVDQPRNGQPQLVTDTTPAIHGESRNTAQMAMVRDAVAQNIGVTPLQLMQGGVAKSDVSFAVRNMEFNAARNIQAAQAKLNAPEGTIRAGDRAQAAIDLRNSQQEFDILKTYGSSVISKGYGKETDKRNLTADRPDQTINLYVTGVDDPQSFAQKVLPPLKEAVKDANNNSASGVSH